MYLQGNLGDCSATQCKSLRKFNVWLLASLLSQGFKYHRVIWFYFFICSLGLVSVEKILYVKHLRPCLTTFQTPWLSSLGLEMWSNTVFRVWCVASNETNIDFSDFKFVVQQSGLDIWAKQSWKKTCRRCSKNTDCQFHPLMWVVDS